ncbi:uncharacterized protein [Temnothorax longispinosus]|uniref:uncharacterized protein n=1 Tax=Temnothorax longispinosus TaxID=300112 RepID=UPI003A98EA0B
MSASNDIASFLEACGLSHLTSTFAVGILADKIVEIFHEERRSTYYTSPIGKSQSRHNKPEVARGKLIDKYRNKLTMLRKTLASCETFTVEEKENISREMQDSQVWLKHNTEPKDEVIRRWKLSFPIRKIGRLSLNEYLEEWPILRTQAAIDLIDCDFKEKFNLQASFDICQKFEDFFTYIYNKRKALLKPSDESLFHLLEDQITTDSKNVIRSYLLSSLVPPRGRAKTGKIYWKPSVSEARDGLFLQVKIPGDIESAKQEKIDFMYKKGLTIQPYIIVVGPNLCNIHAFYVIIDSKTYETKTFLDALKFCFEAYFVLDLKYTPESQHLWFLLQWEVFNIISENDINIPFMNDILRFKT